MASNGAIDYIVAFIGNFDCWRLNTDLPITSMTDARLDAEHLLLFARFFFLCTARRGLCAHVQLPVAGDEPASRQECIRLPLTYYPLPVGGRILPHCTALTHLLLEFRIGFSRVIFPIT